MRRLQDAIDPWLVRMYHRVFDPPPPNLAGDRDIEYSFVAARCGPGPGAGLEVGCGRSALSLVAARHGFRMMAIDLTPIRWDYVHPSLQFIQTDLFALSVPPETFDLAISCSTVEHIGLGRYGDAREPDGDLAAMRRLSELLKVGGTLLLTIPVGRDAIFAPLHRVYGQHRLPQLLQRFVVEEEEFWVKGEGNRWNQTDRMAALAAPVTPTIYGLGCFRLRRAGP